MLASAMGVQPTTKPDARDVRAEIINAASQLVASGGVAALTTRAVAAAASVQPPTLYRLFGDKRGLLDAVAEHGLAAFLRDKVAVTPGPDPVQDLSDAWDAYVSFGLAHPAVFAIMNDPGARASQSPAGLAGIAILKSRVQRIALAGRLRIAEDRAVALIHAVGVGTVTTLLATAGSERDLQVAVDARDAVFAAVMTGRSERAEGRVAALAVGLRAHVGATDGLTPGERLLLCELLDRIAGSRPTGG